MAPSELDPSLSKPKTTKSQSLSLWFTNSLCTRRAWGQHRKSCAKWVPCKDSPQLIGGHHRPFKRTSDTTRATNSIPTTTSRHQAEIHSTATTPTRSSNQQPMSLRRICQPPGQTQESQEKQGTQAALAHIVDLNKSKQKNGIHS